MRATVRVLHVVTRLAVRGVPRHVLDAACELDPGRYEVEIIAGRSEPGEGDLTAEARERGIVVHTVTSLQRAVHPLADLRAYRTIAGIVAGGAYDIVHTHISKAGILGRLAARRIGTPVALHTYHGVIEEVGGASLRADVFRRIERCAAGWSDALVAVSRFVARQWQDMAVGSEDQYRVIPNGIDVDHYAAGEALALAGSPRLVVVGSLTREKGIEVALRALAHLGGEFPDLRFYVVGDGPLRSELEALAGRLGLTARVDFVGIQQDVRSYFAGCDLVLMPSLREGMGLAAVEAMAAERAVVASRTGGLPEVVAEDETGLLVPPSDAQALAAAVAALLRDPQRRQAMGRAGQARARGAFSRQRSLAALAAVYEELLVRKRGST